MVRKYLREKEIQCQFVNGFRKSSRYLYTVHPLAAGSFTYNLNTSVFATKVFVKCLLPHPPHFKLNFCYLYNRGYAAELSFCKFNIVRTLHYTNFNGNWKTLASSQNIII